MGETPSFNIGEMEMQIITVPLAVAQRLPATFGKVAVRRANSVDIRVPDFQLEVVKSRSREGGLLVDTIKRLALAL